MCKVLALSALLANSNTTASASVFSITNNTFPTHCGGTAETWKPNADQLVPPKLKLSLSTIGVNSNVSIVSGSLAVSRSSEVLDVAFGQSITSQYYISIGYYNKSLPNFLFLQEICQYVESNSSLMYSFVNWTNREVFF